mmetsp:Transcript_106223/g.226790  ORF Transcript_106223/g.226790 Transcript_106223/m.226790 type:complete len:116 (-) Transcript_106223:904-1251(-)
MSARQLSEKLKKALATCTTSLVYELSESSKEDRASHLPERHCWSCASIDCNWSAESFPVLTELKTLRSSILLARLAFFCSRPAFFGDSPAGPASAGAEAEGDRLGSSRGSSFGLG